jgi:hypothetical protein
MDKTGQAVNKQSSTNNPVVNFKKQNTYYQKHKQNTKTEKYRI